MLEEWFLHECKGEIVRTEEHHGNIIYITKCNTCGKEWASSIILAAAIKMLKINLTLADKEVPPGQMEMFKEKKPWEN